MATQKNQMVTEVETGVATSTKVSLGVMLFAGVLTAIAFIVALFNT